jgi:hypothetical protein
MEGTKRERKKDRGKKGKKQLKKREEKKETKGGRDVKMCNLKLQLI